LQAILIKHSDVQMKKKLKLKINLIEKNIKRQQEKLQKILNQQIRGLEKSKKVINK
jgi:hypothetical protein